PTSTVALTTTTAAPTTTTTTRPLRTTTTRVTVPPTPPPTAAPRTLPPTTVRTTLPPQTNCPNGTYVNSSGNTVCRPDQAPSPPPGATARCVDGTYSFSQHRQGTCSHHGGVAEWL